MIHLWRLIKSIFVNDAHGIVSKRGKEIIAEQQKFTFIPNSSKSSVTRTESDSTDLVIGVNGKRRKRFFDSIDYEKIR